MGQASGLRPPATIVIGEVAALGDRLSWFDSGNADPLFCAKTEAGGRERRGERPKKNNVA